MKADTICCYCISKCLTKEHCKSQHAYMTNLKARLTVIEVGIFFVNTPTPLSEEPLRFIAHGCIFGRFRYCCFKTYVLVVNLVAKAVHTLPSGVTMKAVQECFAIIYVAHVKNPKK